MKNFQSLIDPAKKLRSATCMVLYEVTTYQMTQNLNINAQNLDRLSEKKDVFKAAGTAVGGGGALGEEAGG